VKSVRLLGQTIHFNNADNFAFLYWETFLEGQYLDRSLRPRTIVDCGSNIGMSIVLFKSLWPDSRLLAVEAAPETFALLRENVQNLPGVTLIHKAVSDRSGKIAFYPSDNQLLGSTNASRGGPNLTEVDAIPLSELIKDQVDLLKIDIEGSEMTAFRDLESSGKLQMIQEMFIEYHHHLPGEKQQLAEFLSRLERSGFNYELASSLPLASGGFQDVFIRARRSDWLLAGSPALE
jgi:FkbM family methyltransferase